MHELRAGALTAVYENGFLRRITYGQSEVLRMIYFALRDHNWNTLPGELVNESVTAEADHFNVSYDYLQRDGGRVLMTWKASIRGQAEGTIVFEIAGTAREDFQKNRAGFCVLHPLGVLGQTCNIRHPDKSQSSNPFPHAVAPNNPFRDIASMSWECGGHTFSLEFEGDIFETEDQRNWGDASFKTFCTPLDKPFPVAMEKGQEVFQRITLKPLAVLQPIGARSTRVELSPSATTGKVPLLGIGASTEERTVADPARSLLRALRLHHYRIDVHVSDENWVTDFSGAYETAYILNLPLEVALHVTGNFEEELEAFVVLCLQNKVRLRKVLLLQTNALVTGQEIIDRLPQIRQQLPNVLFGVGTNYNYNEINKNRFRAGDADYISFSMDPQEHAADDRTLLENTETPAHLVNSARAIYGPDKQIHLSPLTLRRRFNPYATNPEDLYIDESQKADPRQQHAFAAVWTFAGICSLVKGNAAACTLFQTIGNQGIIAADGNPYPVYAVIKAFSPFQQKRVDVLESSDPHAVQGIVLDGQVLGLANLTQEERMVRWNGTDFALQPWEARFQRLDRAQ